MVRDCSEPSHAGATACIDHEYILVRDRGGYLILIPGDYESIPEAGGESIAVAPDDVESLEENR